MLFGWVGGRKISHNRVNCHKRTYNGDKQHSQRRVQAAAQGWVKEFPPPLSGLLEVEDGIRHFEVARNQEGAGNSTSPSIKSQTSKSCTEGSWGLPCQTRRSITLLRNDLVITAACPLGIHFSRFSLREGTGPVLEAHPWVSRTSWSLVPSSYFTVCIYFIFAVPLIKSYLTGPAWFLSGKGLMFSLELEH